MSLRDRIHALQAELGIVPKRSLGQNFLISDGVVENILAATFCFSPTDLVEIGPGLGSLTHGILERLSLQKSAGPAVGCSAAQCSFQVIELDSVFANYWRSQNLRVIEEDALHVDWTKLFSGEPSDKGNEPHTASVSSSGSRVLVSNLPYQISSRLVIERCLDEKPFTGMVLMFQKEVAQRIQARLEHGSYGFLSVMAQTFWDVKTVCEVGPRDFEPPPNVASRVLSFRSKASSAVGRPEHYLKFIKACFVQPRKIMMTNLGSLGDFKREAALSWLKAHGFMEKVRAEELKVQDFLSLAGHLGYL